jgi:hypothetical protein
VAVVARAATARVLLAVTVLWAGTMGVASPPLVRSYGGDGVADVQEPGAVESSVEVLCMEEPFHFRRGLAGSSEELRQEQRW